MYKPIITPWPHELAVGTVVSTILGRGVIRQYHNDKVLVRMLDLPFYECRVLYRHDIIKPLIERVK